MVSLPSSLRSRPLATLASLCATLAVLGVAIASLGALALSPARARAQALYPCRDANHEPAPCPAGVAEAALAEAALAPAVVMPAATVMPPAVVAPASVALPSSTSGQAPAPVSVYDREGGYSQLGLIVANVDVRRLHLTPQEPGRLPAIARGLLVHGESAPLGLVLGGLTLAYGMRPVPFLRFPELRLAVYGGDVEPSGTITEQPGEVVATVTSLVVVRADLGIGLEAHAGPVGFYATARAGIAGYFADAHLEHRSLGDFGSTMLAEDAFEVGWELAISCDLDDGVAFRASAEGMHLGAETLGASFGVGGTF